jgi:hypothetical protein
MILIIGDNDENFKAKDFVPYYFSEEYIVFNWPRKEKLYSRENLKKEVFQIIKEKKISAVIISLNQDPLFYERELMELGQTTIIIGVFYDDTFTSTYSLEASYYCDYVLTADPNQAKRYQTIGVPASLHIGNINATTFKMKDVSRDIDVLLYGTNEKGRREKYEYIKRNLTSFKVLDISSSTNKIPLYDFIGILNRSKITVNFSGVRLDLLPNNFGDPLLNHYKQFKGRIVESLVMGCVCLTDNELSEKALFTTLFDSQSDLVSQIKNLLANPDLLKSLSLKSHQSAIIYLDSIQKKLKINQIKKREKILLKNSVLDKVTATYSLDNAFLNLKNKRFSNFYLDIKKIPFSKVKYVYFWKRKLKSYKKTI